MARMPGAKWLGEHSPMRPMKRYDRIIIHTAVSRVPVHTPHFSVAGNGTIYQSRDTKYQSAVSLEGNPTSIGIETEDRGPLFPNWNVNDGHAVPGFTDAQIEAIAKICAWAHKEHGIPLIECPSSRPGTRGIAWHRMGIDGNFLAAGYKYGGRAAGGERWSEAYGKVCPGDRRITQIKQQVIKRARQIAGLDEEDDPLAAFSEKQLLDLMERAATAALEKHDKKQIGEYVTGTPILFGSAGPARYGHLGMVEGRQFHAEEMNRLAEIAEALNVVLTAVQGLPEDAKAAVREALKSAVVKVDVNVATEEGE